MAGGDVRYVITVDESGATKKIESFENAIKGLEKTSTSAANKTHSFGQEFTSRLIPSFTVATLAADVITGGLRSLGSQIEDTFNEAMEAERATRALNSALEITGRTVPGMAEDLEAYAASLQRITVYDDDAIKGTETLLAQMTSLDEEGIKKATRGSIGLASTLGIDLRSAAMMVTKAMEGNFQTLQRYGIKIDETLPLEQKRIALMEMLEKMFKRATDETNSAWGATQQLNNTLKESKEKIGRVFLPAITAGAQAVGNLLSKIVGLKDEIADMDGKAKRAAATNEIYADAFYLITARAGRTSDYITRLTKNYDYNYEAIIALIEGGKLGPQLEAEWNRERDKTLAKVKALTQSWKENEKGTKTANEGSAEAAKKMRDAIQALIDKADPLRAKYSGILDDMTLVDGAFKTGKISASDYGKVMGWLQEQLRDVDEAATRLGETALPRVNQEFGRWAMSKAPGLFASSVKKSLKDIPRDVAAFIPKLQPIATAFTDIGNQIAQNETIRLDNEYKQRLDYINRTITDEDAKQKAIEALEAEYQIKRSEAAHKAAAVQKAASIAQAIINTAEGYTKALAQGGFIFGIPMAQVVAALGAVQVALIAAQPIPLAEGGYFKKRTLLPGPGRDFEIGEAGEEIASPVPVMRKIVREEAGASAGNINLGGVTVNIYAQTLDDRTIDQAADKITSKVKQRLRNDTHYARALNG